MPKGASTADDLAVRLSWPHPATPLPPGTAGDDERRADGTCNGTAQEGLALVIQRLDSLAVEVRALGQHVESLAAAMAQHLTPTGPTSENPSPVTSGAADSATASPSSAPAKRASTRRRATA